MPQATARGGPLDGRMVGAVDDNVYSRRITLQLHGCHWGRYHLRPGRVAHFEYQWVADRDWDTRFDPASWRVTEDGVVVGVSAP